MSRQNALGQMQDVDTPQAGQDINRQQKIYFSHIFIPVSTALSPQLFFTSGTLGPQYQNQKLPLVTSAYKITDITVTHDMRFTNSDPLLQVYALEQFLAATIITILVNDAVKFTSPLLPLVSQEPVPIVPGTAATELGIRNRFNNWFHLDEPLNLPLNVASQVQFNPPASLTSGATSATLCPVWPNAGLTSNLGYSVMIMFNGYEYKPSN